MSSITYSERIKGVFAGDIAAGWDTKGKLIAQLEGNDNIVYDAIRKYGNDGMTVLDVGCATGKLLSVINKKFKGCQLYGIDICDDMVCYASKIEMQNDNKKNIIADDFLEYNFGDSLFDMIIFKFVLHHLEDQIAALKKAKQLLKEKGILLIYTPGRNHFAEIFPTREEGEDILGRMSIKELQYLFHKCNMDLITWKECRFRMRIDSFENFIYFLKRIGSYQKIVRYTKASWDEVFLNSVKQKFISTDWLEGEYILGIYQKQEE